MAFIGSRVPNDMQFEDKESHSWTHEHVPAPTAERMGAVQQEELRDLNLAHTAQEEATGTSQAVKQKSKAKAFILHLTGICLAKQMLPMRDLAPEPVTCTNLDFSPRGAS